jgi:outer membrane protein
VDTTSTPDTVGVTFVASVTLEQAFTAALRRSPVSNRADAVARLARGAMRVAKAEYLPYATATSSLAHNGAPVLPGTPLSGVIGPTSVGGGSAGTGSPGGGQADSAGIPRTTGVAASASRAPRASFLAAPDTTQRPTDVGAQGSNQSSTTSTPFATPSATLIAGWDVFTAGRRRADNERARAETDAADAIAVRQRYVVYDSVQLAFYEVLRGQDFEQLASEQELRAREDAREAARRHDVGTATTAEVLQFQLDFNTARVAHLQAQIDLRSGAFGLGRLIGVDGAAAAVNDRNTEVRRPLLPDSAIIALAREAAPVLVAARDSARAAAAALRAARSDYFPTIRLGSSYTWASSAVVTSAQRPGWAVGVSTTYPIFNGFVREFNIQRSAEAATLARTIAVDAEHKALADSQRLLGALSLSIEQTKLALQSVTTASENYRVQYNRYHLALATALELRTAEQQLNAAEEQLVVARYTAILARADLELLVGRAL